MPCACGRYGFAGLQFRRVIGIHQYFAKAESSVYFKVNHIADVPEYMELRYRRRGLHYKIGQDCPSSQRCIGINIMVYDLGIAGLRET